MRKVSLLVLVALMCVALGVGAAAEAANDSLKLLGAWEITEDDTQYIMKFGANGIGEYFTGGEKVGEFAFVLRGNTMAAAMLDEKGEVIYEKTALAFEDADTVTATKDGAVQTLKRTEASAETAITLDNPFLGTWVADLPEGNQVFKGVVMEYKPDGTYAFKVGDMEGECSYLVLNDTMVSLSDEGLEAFTFVVVDADNLDVTSPEGKTARFVRQKESTSQAA
jgi:hypothetical protein